jgi:hypothetical protein
MGSYIVNRIQERTGIVNESSDLSFHNSYLPSGKAAGFIIHNLL